MAPLPRSWRLQRPFIGGGSAATSSTRPRRIATSVVRDGGRGTGAKVHVAFPLFLHSCADLLDVCLLTDPTIPRKTAATKKTRRRVVLPPAGILNAAQYETGLTACVGGRNMPVHHVSCVLAEPTDGPLVYVEVVPYL